MAVAITASGLSKRYRIGELQSGYGTLRESISRAAKKIARGPHRHHHEEIWALRDVSFDLLDSDRSDYPCLITQHGHGCYHNACHRRNQHLAHSRW